MGSKITKAPKLISISTIQIGSKKQRTAAKHTTFEDIASTFT